MNLKKNHKNSHNILIKFTNMRWAVFKAVLDCMQSRGRRLDKLDIEHLFDVFNSCPKYLSWNIQSFL